MVLGHKQLRFHMRSKRKRRIKLHPPLQQNQVALLEENAKSEHICLLKSLAKLLINRIEVACAAKQALAPVLALPTPHPSSTQDGT